MALALEIPQDQSVALAVGRIPRARSAELALAIPLALSAAWAVGRILRGRSAASGSAAATALGCCANRSIGSA